MDNILFWVNKIFLQQVHKLEVGKNNHLFDS